MGEYSIMIWLQQPVDPRLLWVWVLGSGSMEKAGPKGVLQRESASWAAGGSSTGIVMLTLEQDVTCSQVLKGALREKGVMLGKTICRLGCGSVVEQLPTH